MRGPRQGRTWACSAASCACRSEEATGGGRRRAAASSSCCISRTNRSASLRSPSCGSAVEEVSGAARGAAAGRRAPAVLLLAAAPRGAAALVHASAGCRPQLARAGCAALPAQAGLIAGGACGARAHAWLPQMSSREDQDLRLKRSSPASGPNWFFLAGRRRRARRAQRTDGASATATRFVPLAGLHCFYIRVMNGKTHDRHSASKHFTAPGGPHTGAVSPSQRWHSIGPQSGTWAHTRAALHS